MRRLSFAVLAMVLLVPLWLLARPGSAHAARMAPHGVHPHAVRIGRVAPTVSGPVQFAQPYDPVGITADLNGNVWVAGSDSVGNSVLYEYAANGSPVGTYSLSSALPGTFSGHLATDPASSLLYYLTPDGTLAQFNAATLQIGVLGHLNQLTVDTSAVCDINLAAIGQPCQSNFGGTIIPSSSNYGDIALRHWTNTQGQDVLDVYVTAVSVAIPYIERLRFVAGTFSGAVIPVGSSTADTYTTIPRGVAANAQGIVLTTLPILQTNQTSPDYGIALTTGYPEDPGTPPWVISNTPLASQGMTTDAAGSFYIATGSTGTPLCASSGAGVMVVLNATITSGSCRAVGGTVTNSQDAAISPSGDAAYMTISPFVVLPPPPPGLVVAWSQSVTVPRISTTGVFRPSNGTLYLKNSNSTGYADIELAYGQPGDLPVTGDWIGQGFKTIGVYRNGQFLLRNSNTTGYADEVIPFGASGDIPVAGDWTGIGRDTIGVYRPSNSTFYLRNTNTAGPPDLTVTLGVPGDVPIVGDWTGQGFDTVGVFRPSNGVVYMRSSNTTGFADIAFVYGVAGDKPVVGDWTGQGKDTIGVDRNGQFLLRNSNSTGPADISFALGVAGDDPIAGPWVAPSKPGQRYAPPTEGAYRLPGATGKTYRLSATPAPTAGHQPNSATLQRRRVRVG